MIENEFCLDGWHIDIASGKISRNGESRHLEPQVMKVLCYLASRPNVVVKREELFEELWRHSFVCDAALTRCIFEIRRAFGDVANDPRIIETVPRVGFRLVATVVVPKRSGTNLRRAMFLATAASLILSAFLFQTNFGGGQGTSTDSVLSPAHPIYVTALSYMTRPIRASNQNAIYLLEKAIEIDPSYGPAYAGLANALVQQIVYWGGDRRLDAESAGHFAMRLAADEAVSHNANGLLLELAGDPNAAIAAFEYANGLDPAYVEPIFNIANVYRRQLKFNQAVVTFEQVVDRVPNHTVAMGHLAFLNLRMGNPDVASNWIRRATIVDPTEPYANSQLATLRLVTGDPAGAIEVCEKLLDLFPQRRACLRILGTSNLALGNFTEAKKWFLTLKENYENSEYALLGEAQVLMSSDQYDLGLALVDEVLDRVTTIAHSGGADWSDYWVVAACYSLKGDANSAFPWLKKAADAGRRFHLWDATDTVFSDLRGDPRFAQYIATTMTFSNSAY